MNEIKNELSGKTQVEIGIEGVIKNVEAAKRDFIEKTDQWKRQVPNEYRNFDYDFVMANREQFNSIDYLTELRPVEQLMHDGVAEARSRAEQGDIIRIGKAEVSQTDDEAHKLLFQAITDFEDRENRDIRSKDKERWDTQEKKCRPINFQGLKFGEGIEFLQRLGMLYYDLQLDRLKHDLSLAKSKRATWKLQQVMFPDYAKGLVVCSVCARLISEVGPRPDYSDIDDDRSSSPSEDSIVYGDETNDLGGPENKD